MKIACLTLSVVLLVAPASVNAQIVVHTSLASFLAAATAPAVDTFDDIPRSRFDSPLFRNSGGYQFYANTGTSRAGFLPGGTETDTWLRPYLATEFMTFGFFPAPIQAFGGYMFGTDASGAFAESGLLTVTVRDAFGTLLHTLIEPQLNTFVGFTSASGLFSVSLQMLQPQNGALWVAANNVRVGALAVAVVPEPTTFALLVAGLTALGATSVRRKKRLAFRRSESLPAKRLGRA